MRGQITLKFYQLPCRKHLRRNPKFEETIYLQLTASLCCCFLYCGYKNINSYISAWKKSVEQESFAGLPVTSHNCSKIKRFPLRVCYRYVQYPVHMSWICTHTCTYKQSTVWGKLQTQGHSLANISICSPW